MIDYVRLNLCAGDGGDGRIAFLSNRYNLKGGPDGGDGGKGGNIIAIASGQLHTLRDFAGKNRIEAKNGQIGGKQKMTGRDAEDILLKLPVGTKIWRVVSQYQPVKPKRMYRIDRELGRVERSVERKDGYGIIERGGVFELKRSSQRTAYSTRQDEETDVENETTLDLMQNGVQTLKLGTQEYEVELVGELTQDGERVRIAKGGRGGNGNWQFRSSRNTTPMEAETGESGEKGEYIFELNMLADVGLIGVPNVGKSTLLSVLTNANPKIANYEFTTLEPNLGVLSFEHPNEEKRGSVFIADIPGIIQGAHEGKGLGLEFLRHIVRCRVLVFVLSQTDEVLLDENLQPKQLSTQLASQYRMLEAELTSYAQTHPVQVNTSALGEKRRILTVNKADLVAAAQKETVADTLAKQGIDATWISAKSGEGIETLKEKIRQFTSLS